MKIKTTCPKCGKIHEVESGILSMYCNGPFGCGKLFQINIEVNLEPDAENIGSNINSIKLTKEKTFFRLEELELKCEIPFPEWFMIMRDLKSLKNFTYIDAKNQCAAMFKPYITKNLFDVAIEIAPIHIGKRFEQMNSLN